MESAVKCIYFDEGYNHISGVEQHCRLLTTCGDGTKFMGEWIKMHIVSCGFETTFLGVIPQTPKGEPLRKEHMKNTCYSHVKTCEKNTCVHMWTHVVHMLKHVSWTTSHVWSHVTHVIFSFRTCCHMKDMCKNMLIHVLTFRHMCSHVKTRDSHVNTWNRTSHFP